MFIKGIVEHRDESEVLSVLYQLEEGDNFSEQLRAIVQKYINNAKAAKIDVERKAQEAQRRANPNPGKNSISTGKSSSDNYGGSLQGTGSKLPGNPATFRAI